jgi:hypothetical protein
VGARSARATESRRLDAGAAASARSGTARLSEPREKDKRVDEAELKARLSLLLQEHRDLDAAIAALAQAPGVDALQLARLKKRKLRLKDEIRILEDMLIPDIIA